jgi:formyl-CoA transferase
VPTVDVVIVNFRPETSSKLRIDYETLRAINHRLIYAEITAVGRRGPASHVSGYDVIVQAISGLMAAGGRADGDIPLPINPPVADLTTGIVVASAVSAALFAREHSGMGQKVETSLLAAALLLQGPQFLRVTGPPRDPDWSRLTYPYYRTYQTADGMVSVAAVTPNMRRRFEEIVKVVHPLHAQKHIPRGSPEAEALTTQFILDLSNAMVRRPTDEWMLEFQRAGVPAGPYRVVDDLVDDPQVRANNLTVGLHHQDLGDMTMVGPVVGMSETPTAARSAPPQVGQDNEEILFESGYSLEEIARLIEVGVLSRR